MMDILRRYNAFIIGAVVLAVVVYTLKIVGFILIPNDAPVEVMLIMAFWWLAISLFLYNIEYFKKRKTLVIKGVTLLIIMILTIGTDEYFDTPDHPLVIVLLVVFWLGVLYLLFPKFFIKYSRWILISYGLILTYFVYLRMDSDYLQLYHNRAMNLLMLPIHVIAVLWLYEQWKWFRSLKTERAKAELELLKNQVNPHFFFNTLNNLYSLSVKHSDKAPEVILKLSEMMRYTIYEGKKELVSLEEEIEYLENYIALHEIRHHRNVDIQFTHNVEPGEKVPPLMFIVLLENAFKHGVEKLTKDAYVHIHLNCNNGHLRFTIKNNFDAETGKNEEGIGLENLNRRLKLLYPNTHTLVTQKDAPTYQVELIIDKV